MASISRQQRTDLEKVEFKARKENKISYKTNYQVRKDFKFMHNVQIYLLFRIKR